MITTLKNTEFLNVIFNDTPGEIVICPDDNEPSIYDRAAPLPDGLVWLSLSTRQTDDLGAHVQQKAIAAPLKPGQTCIVPPSMFIEHADPEQDTYGVWLLDAPLDVSEAGCHAGLNVFLRTVGMYPDSAIDDPVPLPGTAGWTLRECEPRLIYKVSDVACSMWNEAIVYGDLDTGLLDQVINIALSKRGAATKKGGWFSGHTSVRAFIEQSMSKHEVGRKDGNCVIAGGLVAHDRNKQSITEMSLLIQDYDTGESMTEAAAKARAEGVFTIFYHTHSNGGTDTAIARDKLQAWVKKQTGDKEVHEPTLDEVREYLIKVKKVRPSVLNGVTIKKTHQHVDGHGVCLIVSHMPLEKFRSVEVLAEPFVFAAGVDTADRAREWSERYHGKAMKDDTFADQSCASPDRLYYTPRHADGKDLALCKIVILAGRTRRIEEYDRVTAYDLKNRDKGGWELGNESEASTAAFKTPGLTKWAKYCMSTFDAVLFMREKFPDDERGSTNDGGTRFRCPNVSEHSDGDVAEDNGCAVYNACDAKSGRATFICKHDHCMALCAGKGGMHDSLPMIDLACVAADVKQADELREWCDGIVEEDEPANESETEDTGETEKPVPYKNKSLAQQAIRHLAQGDKEAAAYIARCIGLSGLQPAEQDAVINSLAKKSDLGRKVINNEIKAARVESLLGASDAFDDDVAGMLGKLNKQYAVVEMGNHVLILHEQARGVRPTFVGREDFHYKMRSKKVKIIESDGSVKLKNVGTVWSDWSERREYDKVVFEPSGCNPRWFNMWPGIAVEGKPGNWELLRKHVFENVCLGNLEYFNWLMTWLAQIFQQPGIKLGSSVVIKGKKGTGKSVLFDLVREALGDVSLKVSHKDHIINPFNSHQAGLVLMICEEAFWAGDASTSGVLKDLVTSDEMLMTLKGVDSTKVRNFMRMVMISNEDWVVPAGFEDERRFFVLECGDDHCQDIPYFSAIVQQMENGGLEAMVHDLMNWKPDMFDLGWDALRVPPKTPWLKEQADHGRSPADQFIEHLVESLEDTVDLTAMRCPRVGRPERWNGTEMVPVGGIDLNLKTETRLPTKDLLNEFVEWMAKVGTPYRERHAKTENFAREIAKRWAIEKKHIRTGSVFVVPPVEKLREIAGLVDE